jgi:OOP family OmpA-OmpF porin
MDLRSGIFRRIGLGAVLCVVAAAATAAEDLRATLFAEADAALQAANEVQASVLAPAAYGEGAGYYRSAEDNLQRNRSIESIRKDLKAAVVAFKKATEATRLANVTLANAIQSRNDAVEADAGTFASELWRDAETKFASAARRLEDGNVNSARSRAADAETLYREAELAAIKTNYLDETRRLIAQAGKDKVKRYAPETLAKAEALLAQAEEALSTNRYDTDEPRNLAREAKYEVKHAMHLAETLKQVRDKKVTLEQFALASEQPVVDIAAQLDLVAELDQGFAGPTDAIKGRIESLLTDSYELGETRLQVASLEEELGTQSERMVLQEQQRRRVNQVEANFGPGEAQIFTQGENVLIRPIGLVFPTGSSQIQSQYFGILRKVQDAIRVFPDTVIVIEGHTDSFGSDDNNLRLSQDRATSVREYLLANMRDLSPQDVQAIGLGESKPVANNETGEGRARNRRIDLVIKPKELAVSSVEN